MLTRVASTSLGIELYVQLPTNEDSLSVGAIGELSPKVEIMVGLVAEINDLRTELGSMSKNKDEPSSPMFFEVTLADDICSEYVSLLGVKPIQNFLVPCRQMWECREARMMIVQYELFCFEDQAAFSPWSGSSMDLQLMVQSLQHKDLHNSNIVSEVRQLAQWWWPYLKEKIRVMRQVKFCAAKLGMGKRQVLGFREQSLKLFRTQVTVFDDPPSMPIFNPTSQNLEGASVVCEIAIRKIGNPSDLTLGYTVQTASGMRKMFSSDHAQFRELCENNSVFKSLIHDYQVWHFLKIGSTTEQLLQQLLKKARVRQLLDSRSSAFWLRISFRCRFQFNADVLFTDKQGVLRPGYILRQVDDDMFTVLTRCFKRKNMHDYKFSPFVAEHCDRLLSAVQTEQATLEAALEQPGLPAQARVKSRQGAQQAHCQPEQVMVVARGGRAMNHSPVVAEHCDRLLLAVQAAQAALEAALEQPGSPAQARVKTRQGAQQARCQPEQVMVVARGGRAVNHSLLEEALLTDLGYQAASRDRAKMANKRPKQKGLERAFAQAHEMQVTRCVQFNDKLYYIFTRQDGAEQRLTAAGVATARLDVKQLVQAYTAWHQETYGMAIAESLQLVVDHSDKGCKGVSNAELSAGLGCKPELELQSLGEDFEAGSPDQHDPSVSSTELADAGHQVSAIQANEDRAKMVNKRPKQKGLERAFAQAHEMQVTRCVQFNDKLYYIFTRQDGAEQRLTASGVAAARLDVKQLVQAYTAWHQATYGMTIAESLQSVVSHSTGLNDSSAVLSAELGCKPELKLQSLGDEFEEAPPGRQKVRVRSGKLVDAVHCRRYMLRSDSGHGKAQVGLQHDDELLKALRSQCSAPERDFLAEQEVQEFNGGEVPSLWRKPAAPKLRLPKEVEATLQVDPEKAALEAKLAKLQHKLKEKMFKEKVVSSVGLEPTPPDQDALSGAIGTVMGMMAAEDSGSDSDDEMARFKVGLRKKDARPKLPAKAVAQDYRRCARFTCDQILEPNQTKCFQCGCMAVEGCICDECGHTYDPNQTLTCTRCDRVLPHDVRAYQHQTQSEKMAISLSNDNKSASGEKSRSQKTEQLCMENTVFHRMLDAAGHGAPRMIAGMPSATACAVSLERISTRAARDHRAQTQFVYGSDHIVTYNLLFYHSRQLWGMLGQGASLWEFLPRSGPWTSNWYWDQDRDSEEMISVPQMLALRDTSLDEKVFLRCVDNMGLSMVKFSGQEYKQQLEVMSSTLLAYRNSHMAQDRDKRAPFGVLMDIIDALHQQRVEYLSAAAQLSGQTGFQAVNSVNMLRLEFPFCILPEGMTLTDVPEVRVMRLCSEHRHELTEFNFPKKYAPCGCEFDRYVSGMLGAVKDGSSVKDYVCPGSSSNGGVQRHQGVPRGAAAPNSDGDVADSEGATAKTRRQIRRERLAAEKVQLQELAKENAQLKSAALAPIGGSHDVIKGDSASDKFKHVRVGPHSFGEWWSELAYRQTAELMNEVGYTGPIICTQQLSHFGCHLRETTCNFAHPEINEMTKFTLDKIQMYPVLEAFLVGRYDGPWQLQNSARWPEAGNNSKGLKEAIKAFISGKCALYDELHEAFSDSDAEDDGGAGDLSRPNTRSRTQDPTSQRASGRSGESSSTIAQLNRVQFSHKVPSLAEKNTDVVVTGNSLASVPTQMGAVRVRQAGSFELMMESPSTAFSTSVTVVLEVYDCGEIVGDESQRCEIVSGAAVHGRRASQPEQYTAAVMLEDYRKDSATYLDAQQAGLLNGPERRHKVKTSVYNSTLAHMGTLQADDSLKQIESAAVAAAVAKSSEVAPFIGAVMAQPCSMEQAEVKIFKNDDGRLAWHVGVTANCLDQTDPSQLNADVPVVWRYYDENHAYAAKIVKTIVNGVVTVFDESLEKIENASWQGMRLGELKTLTERLELSVGVTYFASKSVEQTLSRERCEMPGFVTQPQEAADVENNLACNVGLHAEASCEGRYEDARRQIGEGSLEREPKDPHPIIAMVRGGPK